MHEFCFAEIALSFVLAEARKEAEKTGSGGDLSDERGAFDGRAEAMGDLDVESDGVSTQVVM